MLPEVGKDFIIEEFVHPELHRKKGKDAIGYLDPCLIKISQHLRDKFGPVTINNWKWGGPYIDSGIRLTYGSRTSAHHFGKALDWKFSNAHVVEVYNYILDNQQMFYDMGLRRIEDINSTPTWLHGDTLETEDTDKVGRIYVFKV